MSLACPNCGSRETTVIDSRKNSDGSRRRRQKCVTCGERFNTIEIISPARTRHSTTDLYGVSKHLIKAVEGTRIALSDLERIAHALREEAMLSEMNKKDVS